MESAGPGTALTVYKLDLQGRRVTSYPATVRESGPEGVVLDARWTRPPLALGYVTFETGDRFIEWFYRDRWYNIFEVRSRDGRLKGWYCNVAAPARISATEVSCRDLLLDLWVAPDGATHTLDEEEFSQEERLTVSERHAALKAIEELRAMATRHEPPFRRAQASGPDVML